MQVTQHASNCKKKRKAWNWERRRKKPHRNTNGKQTDLPVYTCAFLCTTFCEVDKIISISDTILEKNKCITL